MDRPAEPDGTESADHAGDWLEQLSDEAWEALLAPAEADIAAGRVIPWEKVEAWLVSLDTENPMPMPEPDPPPGWIA